VIVEKQELLISAMFNMQYAVVKKEYGLAEIKEPAACNIKTLRNDFKSFEKTQIGNKSGNKTA